MLAVEETIVGVASAAGAAARGIVRLSGPAVIECLAAAFRGPDGSPLAAGIGSAQVVPATLSLPPPLGAVPGDLYIWPNQRSYTRQPAAEFHSFGARPLLNAAVRQLCRSGARLAQPGEFTLRAFLAGRLDLTQAEAVLGVIDARDGEQLEVALGQLAGGLAGPLADIREQLLELLAHLEAGLDFVEEEIEFITVEELTRSLRQAGDAIDQVLAQLDDRSDSGQLPTVVLIGRANAGKSSLFNALSGGQAAIVSDTAGTTRDYLAGRLDLDGFSIELIDTAGVHDPPDEMGRFAQQAAATQARRAALCLVCVEATAAQAGSEQQWEQSGAEQLFVLTKADLVCGERPTDERWVVTSSRLAEGITELKTAIRGRLVEQLAGSSLVVPSTLLRCHASLLAARTCLADAARLAAEQAGEELVAHDLRIALDELGKVLGTVYTDDILDRVFSRFCIGK